MLKKGVAEFIGTFVLVLFGTGTIVLGGGIQGIGILGIALAFGLSLVAMAYSIGTISGCHINPAVSIAMFVNKRINASELLCYLVAQVLGAFLGTAILVAFLKLSNMSIDNLGQNGFEKLGYSGAFLVEAVLTFVFILVIMVVTGKNGNASLAGLVIGLTLVLVHLFGIPLTGSSVNPARSLAPAIFAGGKAVSQLWIYIVAPILGGIIAALVGKFVFNTEK
ncbi:MIP/aquaporin family protein [Neobacillus ginsengisoli]|uniref:Aquaporin Z n=1 Tax=Neobacillus ginsengisoli TaxID=904295 RepID=A0ABT9XXS1_9BACI|nr:MIP family channel protein [Neobacillus ginsengisoli]MDQ0200276.1 aquaporin Z [Neobacillus ginsengisoli]